MSNTTEERNLNCDTYQQIETIDNQIGALVSIVIAIGLSIITLCTYKKVITSGGSTSKSDIKLLQTLPKLSISIIILTAVFFLFESYKTYGDSPTEANKNYLTANILAFTAAYIRFTTIFQSDTFNEGETEQ